MSKQCTDCCRLLPLSKFFGEGKTRSVCRVCEGTRRRLATPLPPVAPNPIETKLNNLTCLWFGPVRREQLRHVA